MTDYDDLILVLLQRDEPVANQAGHAIQALREQMKMKEDVLTGFFKVAMERAEKAEAESLSLRDIMTQHERLWRQDAEKAEVVGEIHAAADALEGEEMSEWTHIKTGGVYTIVADKVLMESDPMILLTVYRGADGVVWARSHKEFHDGRFVEKKP